MRGEREKEEREFRENTVERKVRKEKREKENEKDLGWTTCMPFSSCLYSIYVAIFSTECMGVERLDNGYIKERRQKEWRSILRRQRLRRTDPPLLDVPCSFLIRLLFLIWSLQQDEQERTRHRRIHLHTYMDGREFDGLRIYKREREKEKCLEKSPGDAKT